MRSRIIPIGNSQGVRIPKPLLDQSGLSGEVEVEVEGNQIVIRPLENPRAGWEESFAEMHRERADLLLDGDQLGSTSWDDEEWEW
jgi:antitoxin MazE